MAVKAVLAKRLQAREVLHEAGHDSAEDVWAKLWEIDTATMAAEGDLEEIDSAALAAKGQLEQAEQGLAITTR
ncbi:hypothetical protein LTR95_000912 [Oleoguttula sp. CCFEE 5521]